MTESQLNAAIFAEPDGYDVRGERLMGRQAAGNGYLRAAVRARGSAPIVGYGTQLAAKGFRPIVQAIDPTAPVDWIPRENLARLADARVLYLADPAFAGPARLRLRQGVATYSLCGVTHTTATSLIMEHLAGQLQEPVAPWDALVCTSRAVSETVRVLHEAQADFLRWRLGDGVRIQTPMLPVIPLGVHCDDFAFADGERAAAREALGIEPEATVALFVGRLIFHGKAHPYPMFKALQAAAERTGKPIVLILCGWSPNADIARVFQDGAARHAPDVRTIMVDGRQAGPRRHAWASGDVFMSLADNIQETFGLTPIEAMAAGMPCVVTDWDGYKDTVRDELDGFRIRTWAPEDGAGAPIARAFEFGLSYDHYCWYASAVTAVDIDQLAERLVLLVENPDLRRRMGEAARKRAREAFDWAVVYRHYQALWAEQDARRIAALTSPTDRAWIEAAPKAMASAGDPFRLFGSYPTHTIGGATRIVPRAGAERAMVAALQGEDMFAQNPVGAAMLETVWDRVAAGAETVAAVAAAAGHSEPVIIRATGLLAKLGLVKLE